MRDNPRRNRREKKSLLSKSRWAAYAAAGAATALGVHESAEAGIVYSGPLDIHLDGSPASTAVYFTAKVQTKDGATLDVLKLRHKGFIYTNVYPPYSTFPVGSAKAIGVNGMVAGFASGAYAYASNLAPGDAVSARQFIAQGTMAYFNGYTYSQFKGRGQEGFVGFSFDAGEGTQFGWIKVKMGEGVPHNDLTVLGWAYAGPNEAINAGQVPEPGSLGLLATGALGLLLWRRVRRSEKPAA